MRRLAKRIHGTADRPCDQRRRRLTQDLGDERPLHTFNL
jgi:hypothetical protein